MTFHDVPIISGSFFLKNDLVHKLNQICLRPLHIQAKSLDHEVMRAQKKVSKGRPNTPSKSCIGWSWILKCSVKAYVTGPSAKCHFNEIVFMWVLTLDKIE